MCFVLYAGTSEPLPPGEWRDYAPDVCVQSLNERELPVREHFSKPVVQNIGSTSGCGCDFPHVTLQNGDWPWFEDGELDPEQVARDRFNRDRLVNVLRATGEDTVELYGVWDGDCDFTMPPAAREQIELETILDATFRFKECGFYVVRINKK